MSNIKISTKELEDKISLIKSYIDKLDSTLEKIDIKLKSLSYSNNIYYSSTTIDLYNKFIEDNKNIRELHNSYKNFIQSTTIIIEKYEEIEARILKKIEEISSIQIVE